MTDFITIPLVVGFITLGIYKLFELFVCKRERLTIIEKMGEKFSPEILEKKIDFSFFSKLSFSTLKLGSLLVGLGLGLFAGAFLNMFFRDVITKSQYYYISSALWACPILLCGGIALIIAFLVEIKHNKKNNETN